MADAISTRIPQKDTPEGPIQNEETEHCCHQQTRHDLNIYIPSIPGDHEKPNRRTHAIE